ncbi:putative phytol kinase 1, chloroplastic [Auxenochlorella protothecoides]|uniref:phytol kinase n=1 Tax=Auxenochlorella protothecoides TaxID=3075 RepID=A0A087SIP9_AUXPR|nr:putative phytol kinase 1, chloroplastic [Auxenochlorella protothecoides]KFM25603.1 putative phytol kinase 1, chloroplastic [Auxenochlorella protothecoides]RMZ52537.1 hypothetical protein APUTEX25_003680 [Auxenochlorella protothecoides]|eukprot:RMZ52537.1 hypothetical protein APUTEX25_003680 [Auxenochlorella protothecoides]
MGVANELPPTGGSEGGGAMLGRIHFVTRVHPLGTHGQRNLLAAAFAITGSKLIVQIFDRLEAAAIIDRNLSRKLVHTLAGPLFLVSWPLFASNPESKLIAAAVPFLNVIRLTLVGTGLVRDERVVAAMSRTGDKSELLRGPLFYVLVLFAVTLACWRNSPIVAIIAAVSTGVESLPISQRLDDNLSVPAVALLLGSTLLP